MCDGIELVAEIEKINKKKAAHNPIKRGFSSWMGEKVKNHIDNEKSARELDQKIKLTRYILEMRGFVRERGKVIDTKRKTTF